MLNINEMAGVGSPPPGGPDNDILAVVVIVSAVALCLGIIFIMAAMSG